MVPVLVWQQRLRACGDRPRGRQRRQFDALLALAALLDWPTGTGFASVAQIAKGADVGERTVHRGIRWGQDKGWLRQAKRGHGHKPGAEYGEATASEWELLLPEQPANSTEQPANSTEQPAITTGSPPKSTPPKSTPPSAAQVIMNRTEATLAEATAIAAKAEADPKVRNPAAVLAARPLGALRAEVDRYRQAARPTPIPPGFARPEQRGSEPGPVWFDTRAAMEGGDSRHTPGTPPPPGARTAHGPRAGPPPATGKRPATPT